MRKVFAFSSDVNGEVYYCVMVNESDTCNCSDPVDGCNTLQHFIKNVTATINNPKYGNTRVTLNFMPGSHSVNFTEGVKITAPAQLNLIGLDVNVTVNANRSCNDSEVDCGFFFEGHSRDKHIDISIKI